jgi:hypothetical protein
MNRMTIAFIKWVVLAGMLTVLAACGGGGGSSAGGGNPSGSGSDTLILGITSGVTTTTSYVEKKDSSAEWGNDPDIFGYYGFGNAWVQTYSNYDPLLAWETHILITMPTSTGTQNAQPNSIMYSTRGVGSYFADGNGGTITFNRLDSSPGGKIQGSFDNVSLLLSGGSDIITVSGTFSATVE